MKNVLKVSAVTIVAMMFVISAFSAADAGLKIYEKDDVSLELYGRIQPRYEWKEKDDATDTDAGNDFYVRRTRFGVKIKATENISGKLEWKFDNYLQEGKGTKSKLENAYAAFDYFDSIFIIEFGLKDSVFSREGQVSDSKILFDNKSTIINKIQDERLTDNATGLHIKGKLVDGHLEYGLGIYEGGDDDTQTEGVEDDKLQYAAGLVYHLLDPESRQGSHIGDGKTYLTVGAYYAAQGGRTDGSDTVDVSSYGADVFGQFGTVTFSGGYFILDKDFDIAGGLEHDGYYVEGAYLLPQKVGVGELELAARYQAYSPENDAEEKQTSLGANYYIKKHNVKVQTTYNINEEDDAYGYDPGDNLVVQLQFAW